MTANKSFSSGVVMLKKKCIHSFADASFNSVSLLKLWIEKVFLDCSAIMWQCDNTDWLLWKLAWKPGALSGGFAWDGWYANVFSLAATVKFLAKKKCFKNTFSGQFGISRLSKTYVTQLLRKKALAPVKPHNCVVDYESSPDFLPASECADVTEIWFLFKLLIETFNR